MDKDDTKGKCRKKIIVYSYENEVFKDNNRSDVAVANIIYQRSRADSIYLQRSTIGGIPSHIQMPRFG